MIQSTKRTRTGYTFNIAVVTRSFSVCTIKVMVSRNPDREAAEISARNHVQKKLINFFRFATEKEANYLGENFLKPLKPLYNELETN